MLTSHYTNISTSPLSLPKEVSCYLPGYPCRVNVRKVCMQAVAESYLKKKKKGRREEGGDGYVGEGFDIKDVMRVYAMQACLQALHARKCH